MNRIIDFLKEHRRDIVLFILFFLISTLSFALGYLAAGELTPPSIVIEKIIPS